MLLLFLEEYVICQYCKDSLAKDRDILMKHCKECPKAHRSGGKTYRYMCFKCSYHTQFNGHFSDHIKRHIRLKSFGCAYCSYVGLTRTVVRTHMVYKHSNATRLHCQFCNYASKLESQLKFHVRTKHINAIDFTMRDE